MTFPRRSCRLNRRACMKVKIEFISDLTRYSPAGEKRMTLSLQEGATIRTIWEELHLPEDLEAIWLVNSEYCPETRLLRDGDLVSLCPFLEGG